jgi:hypothetical protein
MRPREEVIPAAVVAEYCEEDEMFARALQASLNDH